MSSRSKLVFEVVTFKPEVGVQVQCGGVFAAAELDWMFVFLI